MKFGNKIVCLFIIFSITFSIPQVFSEKIISSNEDSNLLPSVMFKDEQNSTYLLITSSSLQSSLEFFKNWKEIRGFHVIVKNTTWIKNNEVGRDTAEKIRNCIKDINPRYVLLVGNSSSIPWRFTFKSKESGNAFPSDFYYADTSSDWDSDNDDIFAEFHDDTWPDFFAESYVGRIPVDDQSEVRMILNNVIEFEQNNDDWKRNALLFGAFSNFENEEGSGDARCDNAYLMEDLKDKVFTPNGYLTTCLYEKQGLQSSIFQSDLSLNKENAISELQNKYGIITWGSHGSSEGSYRRWWATDANADRIPNLNEIRCEYFITSESISQLNSSISSILFSCSCSNADPENDKNLGKTLLRNGAVCFIGATKESIYFPGWQTAENEGNMAITYYFFDKLINNNVSIGQALYTTLTDSWYNDTIPIFKNMLTFNIYGDPSLSTESYPSLSGPEIPDKPVGPAIIAPNHQYLYSLNNTNKQNQTVYYEWYWGDNSTSLTGPYQPGENVSMNHSWLTPGDYNISVKALNVVGKKSHASESFQVHVSGPILKINRISGNLFHIQSSIENSGDEPASSINWTISVDGENVLFGKKSNGFIDVLEPGENKPISSPVIFGFENDCTITIQASLPKGYHTMSTKKAIILFSLIIYKNGG